MTQIAKEDRLAFAENQARLAQTIVEQGYSPVMITSKDGPNPWISYVNSAFTALTNCVSENLIGRRLSDLEAVTGPWEPFQRALSTGQPFFGETQLRRGGEQRFVDCNITKVLDHSGLETHWAIILRDVTERKRGEEQAKAALNELRDIKAALDAHSIVAITNAAGDITYVNDKFCQISKYCRDELLGQNHRIVNSGCHPKSFFTEMWRTIARGNAWHGEIKNRAKDGSFYWVDTTIFPFLNEARKPVQYIAIRTDITARKAHKERLAQQANELKCANEALERTNLELQQFVHIMSHDLQTPLRSISGFVQLLKMKYADKLDDQANDWIRRTIQATQWMHTLLQDALAYSRVGSQARPFEPISFREVFDDAIALLEGAIRESGGHVTCDQLPTILGDRLPLTQLMQNLIGNGLKYHGQDPPRVHVSAKRAGSEWVFSVRDNGIGIAPQHHERIFQIFGRLHDRQEHPGTGIGLAVCRRVIHRHEGRIWVESELGQGSDFKFTIPATTIDRR
ncbi:MAG: ATP-binding protein [Verrucomicrobiales bacterium]|nr:ATP-binding protein [Verrucomicrobiales bacterium]